MPSKIGRILFGVGVCGYVYCLKRFFRSDFFKIEPSPSYFNIEPSPAPDGGDGRYWSLEEARKKLEEDATKAGFYMKDPAFLMATSQLYQKCAANHGAESSKCSFYKGYWLMCKAAQNDGATEDSKSPTQRQPAAA